MRYEMLRLKFKNFKATEIFDKLETVGTLMEKNTEEIIITKLLIRITRLTKKSQLIVLV